MTKARRVRVNRTLAIITLIMCMIGATVSAYAIGATSRTPAKVTITHDNTVLLQAESGHIYEYAPEICIGTDQVAKVESTDAGTLLTFEDNTGYFIEK